MIMKNIENLHIIFEDIRNHSTVLAGFLQMTTKDELIILQYLELLLESVSDINKLVSEGIEILKIK